MARAGAAPPLIFLVAGEPSGDMLGARLMAALKAMSQTSGGEGPRFAGVGGERMIAEGLESLFPMRELSVMGYLEVVPKIPRILKRVADTVAAARALAPAAVVTIDSPDFCLRVQKRLAGGGWRRIHYVAPQVWAHRPGRAATIAGYLDHLLALLPFEPPYFETVGLPCTFVGHAVVEDGAASGDGARFRAAHGIAADAPLLCVLPGSRSGEVRRHLPVIRDSLTALAARLPGLRAVLPTIGPVAAEVGAAVADWPVAPLVLSDRAAKYDAFAAADAGLAVSGTVTLELAVAGVPMVVIYRANPLTMWAARRLVRVEHICLVNLVLERGVVPELLQEACRPDDICAALDALLHDRATRDAQIGALREAAALVAPDGPSPSDRAAAVILREIAATA